MKKLILTVSFCLSLTTIFAQNPTFHVCSDCPNGKKASVTSENLIEFFLTKPETVRQVFEKNGYTTEVQPGFCTNYSVISPDKITEVIFKKCENYFQVTQENGTEVSSLIKSLEKNFMRSENSEKWYSVAYKNKRYKFIFATIKNKETLKVQAF